jgi:hypothetical protein
VRQKRKQVHPAGRLGKKLPAREDEKKEENKTNKHETPESGGLGETSTPQPKRLGEHQLHSPNGWENNTQPHGIYHGGSKKHHRGREANKPPFPANNKRQNL